MLEILRKERYGFVKALKPLFPLISAERKFFKRFITLEMYQKSYGIHLNVPFQKRFGNKPVRCSVHPDLWDTILDKYPHTEYVDVFNLTKEIGLVSVGDWNKRHYYSVALIYTDIGWPIKDRIYAC